MSLGTEVSTVSGDVPAHGETRYNTAVHNITRLFDRISAIEDELAQSQNVLSRRVPEEIWSESSVPTDPLAENGSSSDPNHRMLAAPRRASRSVPDHISSRKIDSFRECDEVERRKFLELELERIRERAKVAPSRIIPPLELISERRRFAEVKADLSVAREEVKNLLHVNANLRKQNKDLSIDRERSNGSLTRLKNRLTVLRSENAKLSDSVKSLQSQLSREALSARDSARHAEALHAGARAELITTSAEISQLRDSNRALELELNETRRSAIAYEGKIKSLEIEKEKMAADFLMMENRLGAVENQCRRMESPKRDGTGPAVQQSVIMQLVDQLSKAREDAAAARAEADRATAELGEVRQQFLQALQKEKQLRRRAIENECLSLLSTTSGLGQPKQCEDGGSKAYLRRIRQLQDTVNTLTERLTEYERKELWRAPVKIRNKRHNQNNRAMPRIVSAFSSFGDDAEEVRTGPTPTEELTSN